MYGVNEISSGTLRTWLDTGEIVSIPVIGPIRKRTQWFTSGSVYYYGYDKLKKDNPRAKQGLHPGNASPGIAICASVKTSLIAAAQLHEDIFTLPAYTGRPAAFDNTPFQTTISYTKKYVAVRQLKRKSLSMLFRNVIHQHMQNANPLLKDASPAISVI
jgi:hypothetical protein